MVQGFICALAILGFIGTVMGSGDSVGAFASCIQGAEGGGQFSLQMRSALSGVTSGLSLDRNGRLQRQLTWARFNHGVPQLVDTFLQRKGQFGIENDTALPDKPQPRS